MFRNVIVAVDEYEGARDAIALAQLLQQDGELTLAHVYPGGAPGWRGTSGAYELDQRARAGELLERARAAAGVTAQLRTHGASSVGRGLHELAEAVGADLLVTGSSRRGLLGRVLIGDDTRAALNGAPCAVAITPAGYSRVPTAMHEIGVGYDGSPESEHALAVARRLSAEQHAKLSALEALAFPAHLFSEPVLSDDATIDDLVEQALERLAALEGVEPHAVYGHPGEELTLYSCSLDLLVIGSRGYGPVGRLVHGSTAQQLARTARCPLLVLTRAARKASGPRTSDNGRESAIAGAATDRAA